MLRTTCAPSRHGAAKTLGRGLSVSNDNGDTWGPIIFDKQLTSPVCQGSTVTFGGQYTLPHRHSVHSTTLI